MVRYPRVSLRFTLGYLLAFPTGTSVRSSGTGVDMVRYPRVSLRFTLGYLLAFPTGTSVRAHLTSGLREEIFRADPSLRSGCHCFGAANERRTRHCGRIVA
jgi:hypothetical protein